MASESRSTLAAARALNINAKLLYQWQKAAQQPLPADPHEAADVRPLPLEQPGWAYRYAAEMAALMVEMNDLPPYLPYIVKNKIIPLLEL